MWSISRFGFILAGSMVCGVACGQGSSTPAPQANEVHLSVVVAPKNGAPVAGLQRGDFTLFDNNSPQPITSFRAAGKEQPVEVIIVVDAVNVSAITIAYERQELDKFLLAGGGELARPTSLAILTDKGIRAQGGGTLDGKVLAQSIDSSETGLRVIGRSTGFYGAEERLDISLRSLRLLIEQEAKRPGRKLLVWLSPGWPLLSGPGVELGVRQRQAIFANVVDLSTRLRQADVTLYAVDPLGTSEGLERRVYFESFTKGISKPGETDEGDLGLQVLAVQSGGLVLNSSNDIAGMLKQAVNDASSYYELAFVPAPGEHPNEFHQIEVKVAGQGLVARTRQGYYAQSGVTADR